MSALLSIRFVKISSIKSKQILSPGNHLLNEYFYNLLEKNGHPGPPDPDNMNLWKICEAYFPLY